MHACIQCRTASEINNPITIYIYNIITQFLPFFAAISVLLTFYISRFIVKMYQLWFAICQSWEEKNVSY